MTHLVPVLRPVLGSPFRRASLYRAAGEMPSWHIAPVRTGNVNDLITGSNIITFSNSSPAWGFNSAGILVQPTPNVPFIEYGPATGACLGWRVWDGVTNSFLQSENFATTWSAAGGQTVQVNTTIAPTGQQTADTITIGTSSTSPAQSVTVVDATAYTLSLFINTTQTCNFIRVRATTAASSVSSWFNVSTRTWSDLGAGFANGSFVDCGSNWIRAYISYTPAAGDGGSRSFGFGGVTATASSTADTGNTLIYFGAQLNTGPLAPYVPTTTLSASSTADVASVTGAPFAGIYNPAAVTVYAEAARGNSGNFASYQAIYTLSDNTSNNAIPTYGIEATSAITDYGIQSGGVIQNDFVARSHSTTAPFKLIQALAANDSVFGTDGVLTTQDTSIIMPTGINKLNIGSSYQAFNQWNGYIRELAIFKSRRPNSNLTAMI